MPDPMLSLVSAELAPGERILWSERPDPVTCMMSKGGMALFAIVWLVICGSSVFAASGRGDVAGTLVGLAFMGVGIFMLLVPIAQYRSARGTLFAITPRRLIIARNKGGSLKSILLSGIRQVERIKKRGKITLRIPASLVSDGDGGQKVDYIDLHGLRDGERAYRLLTKQAA